MASDIPQLSLCLETNLNRTCDIFASVSPAKPTIVYDTYWRFAVERQNVFFARIRGETPPWTRDPILRNYKFTNAYRAADRTSQFLIRDVIYEGPQTVREVFFRVFLFKFFNKIQTWEMLKREFGTIRWESYTFSEYDRVLSRTFSSDKPLYSNAYIMPSPRFGHKRKHRNHLRLLETMMDEEAPERIASASSMQEAFEILRGFPSIGNFLAYQFVTDLNYSEITNFSEMEFVVPGPGALDGISKCFEDLGGLDEVDIIKLVADHQHEELERRGLEFEDLWGRPLQLIDCQNLFCEVDKYSRVAHPNVSGESNRTRIKQTFTPQQERINYWFPPKWGINDNIGCQA